MINLRYHIVSIVAVFLALAIGIFAGSTLLDRTILDGLESRQASLNSRNDDLNATNDEYEQALDANDDALADFSEVGGDVLDDTQLAGTPVLFIATRGIDEVAVAQTRALVDEAGGSTLGVLWVGESADLTDGTTAAAMSAAWWGSDPVPEDVETVEALTASMGTALAGSASAGAGASDGGDSEPPVSTTDPNVPPAEDGSETSFAAADTVTDRFGRLVDEGHIEWEPASGAGDLDLDVDGLVTVVLTGEGSDLGPVRFVYPLVDALAAAAAPVVVGEVHRERSTVDRIGDDEAQARGYVVDRFRSDGATAEVVTTLDNVDHPYGRMALMMSMRDGRLPRGGAYGFGDLADAVFPSDT